MNIDFLSVETNSLMKDCSPSVRQKSKVDPFTCRQRDRLLQLREEVIESMTGAAKGSRVNRTEASALPTHQADAGSDAYDRDFALSLLSREGDALYEIDQALQRIESGTYGVCEMSGKPIPRTRLEAIPFARLTVECQSQLEKETKASRLWAAVAPLSRLEDEPGGDGEEETPVPKNED